MQLFIGQISGGMALITGDEARHAAQVLRKKPGDKIHVTDGKGVIYLCIISSIGKNDLQALIQEALQDSGTQAYQLHVAIAPTKNTDRFEWFLEKSTEMGITAIHPIITEHSERTVIKPERLEKVVLSAAKQSLKSTFPAIMPLCKFNDFIKRPFEGVKMIAHCHPTSRSNFFTLYQPGSPLLICIGPEGDFSEREAETAASKGFLPVSLGNSRLRTETAAIVAVAHVYAQNS